MKKLYLMTDLEGVAGVVDADNWIYTHSRYYDLAKELLTAEVNAAIEGFLEGGIEEILVADGHGQGALFSHKLHPRVLYQRGWCGWPLSLDKSYDAIAWVGQHGKAGTPQAHLAHTQSFEFIDFSINGLSVGEPGQFGLCASELGVRAIFGAGDLAFTRELQALYPGIETVSVKHGINPESGDELDLNAYQKHQLCAVHVSPEVSRQRIRAGAERAVRRAKAEKFGLLPIKTPVDCAMVLRPTEASPQKRVSRWSHPTSVIAALNMNWMANVQPASDATQR